jgi:hypothetical protein
MRWKEETVCEHFSEVDAQAILNMKLPSRPADDLIAGTMKRVECSQFVVHINWPKELWRMKEAPASRTQAIRATGQSGKATGKCRYHIKFSSLARR